MKQALLSFAILLSIQGKSANLIHSSPTVNPTIVLPLSKNQIQEPPKKPRRQRNLYYKGKGTMGLLLSLVLGPLGFASVHLFSNNITMREKADTGMAIWVGSAFIGAVVLAAIASRQSVGQLALEFLYGIAQSVLD
jgi:uncharacterized membrane protein YeaQ/YmgE (transglycosylase-associated protein family)